MALLSLLLIKIPGYVQFRANFKFSFTKYKICLFTTVVFMTNTYNYDFMPLGCSSILFLSSFCKLLVFFMSSGHRKRRIHKSSIKFLVYEHRAWIERVENVR